MNKNKKNKKSNKNQMVEVTWAQAFRDVIIKAINSGQLLPVSILLCILVLLFRMPGDKSFEVLMKLVEFMSAYKNWGWGLSILLVIGWASHTRSMRRCSSLEYKRIGIEKSELQRELSQIDLKSSDDY